MDPPFLADVICEQPIIFNLRPKTYSDCIIIGAGTVQWQITLFMCIIVVKMLQIDGLITLFKFFF